MYCRHVKSRACLGKGEYNASRRCIKLLAISTPPPCLTPRHSVCSCSVSEISRLQEEFNDLENRMYNHMVNGPNSTAASFPDISKLKELLDKLLSRQTAVLHLISDRINISEGREYTFRFQMENGE